MRTGDITLVRGDQRIPLELDPAPPEGDHDPFTRYVSRAELLTGDRLEIEGRSLDPGVAIKFSNAVVATHPQTGALYVFGVTATAAFEET